MTNIPNVRFKGFTDDWEQRKLEEYLEVSSEKNFEGTFTREDVLSVSGEIGIVNQIEFQGRSFAGASVLNYGVVGTGDVVYTKSPLKTNPYGIIKTNKGKPGIVSTLYAVYHAKPNVFPDFVQCYFEQDVRVNNYLHPLVNKGAKNDMKVSAENALKGTVIFPERKEQMAIAGFFSILDHLITLHQRKCDETKELKKYMLKKMFPQNGKKIPEIRFKGFTDDWKQHKLGEIADRIYGGGTPKTDIMEYWDGYIPWIQSSNLTEHELFNVDIQKHITDDGLKKSAAQLVPPNSIAIVSHVGVGKLVFMPFSYTTSQDFISLSELKADPIFTCYSVYKKLQNDLHIVQGSAIKGITKDDLLSKEIMLPSEPEQIKIGDYFRQLDYLITLHQHKCDELKEVKKFMLKNMFPQKG